MTKEPHRRKPGRGATRKQSKSRTKEKGIADGADDSAGLTLSKVIPKFLGKKPSKLTASELEAALEEAERIQFGILTRVPDLPELIHHRKIQEIVDRNLLLEQKEWVGNRWRIHHLDLALSKKKLKRATHPYLEGLTPYQKKIALEAENLLPQLRTFRSRVQLGSGEWPSLVREGDMGARLHGELESVTASQPALRLMLASGKFGSSDMVNRLCALKYGLSPHTINQIRKGYRKLAQSQTE